MQVHSGPGQARQRLDNSRRKEASSGLPERNRAVGNWQRSKRQAKRGSRPWDDCGRKRQSACAGPTQGCWFYKPCARKKERGTVDGRLPDQVSLFFDYVCQPEWRKSTEDGNCKMALVANSVSGA